MSIQFSRSYSKLLALAAIALVNIPGCGSEPAVGGSAVVFTPDHHEIFAGNILEFNGLYGPDCVARSGKWSLPAAALSQQTNPSLSVVKNNVGCVLSLTSVRAGNSESSAALYNADAPIPLAASFQAAPVAFKLAPQSPVAFYANARLEPDASFQTDFSIRLAYSAQPTELTASKQSNFAVEQSSVIAIGIPAPDYQVDLTRMDLLVDVNYIVQSTSGTVDLMVGIHPGDRYVITSRDFGSPPMYGAVDSAFLSGAQMPIMDLNPAISAAEFALEGENLSQPVKRTIIVSQSVSAARSYQLVSISFFHP